MKVPLGVVTLTLPVVAPLGTAVVILVLETTVNPAAVLLKVTLVEPVNLFPSIFTAVLTLPEVGSVATNGPSPTAKLKTVPQPGPLLVVFDRRPGQRVKADRLAPKC